MRPKFLIGLVFFFIAVTPVWAASSSASSGSSSSSYDSCPSSQCTAENSAPFTDKCSLTNSSSSKSSSSLSASSASGTTQASTASAPFVTLKHDVQVSADGKASYSFTAATKVGSVSQTYYIDLAATFSGNTVSGGFVGPSSSASPLPGSVFNNAAVQVFRREMLKDPLKMQQAIDAGVATFLIRSLEKLCAFQPGLPLCSVLAGFTMKLAGDSADSAAISLSQSLLGDAESCESNPLGMPVWCKVAWGAAKGVGKKVMLVWTVGEVGYNVYCYGPAEGAWKGCVELTVVLEYDPKTGTYNWIWE